MACLDADATSRGTGGGVPLCTSRAWVRPLAGDAILSALTQAGAVWGSADARYRTWSGIPVTAWIMLCDTAIPVGPFGAVDPCGDATKPFAPKHNILVTSIEQLEKLPNGRAWQVRSTGSGINPPLQSGVCFIRYPQEPGPHPEPLADYRGVCFAVDHEDWYYEIEIGPQFRAGTHFQGMATGVWREEVRIWFYVSDPVPGSPPGSPVRGFVGAYTAINVITSLDAQARWDSRFPEIEFTSTSTAREIFGTEVAVSATAPGSYTARRAIHEPRGDPRSMTGFGDMSAPFLNAGISTSLTINPDGSLFGQDEDGCVFQGKTDDHLGGVFRVNLTDSCLPGATFASFGATIEGRLYLAGHFNLETLKIVASL